MDVAVTQSRQDNPLLQINRNTVPADGRGKLVGFTDSRNVLILNQKGGYPGLFWIPRIDAPIIEKYLTCHDLPDDKISLTDI